jgi:hypothetical protein
VTGVEASSGVLPPPSTISIKRPCTVVVSAHVSPSVAEGNARRDRALLQCEPLDDFAVD